MAAKLIGPVGGQLAAAETLVVRLGITQAGRQGLPYLEGALQRKQSDNLKQYVRQVERAANKQKEREAREAAEAEDLKKELEKAKAAENAEKAAGEKSE